MVLRDELRGVRGTTLTGVSRSSAPTVRRATAADAREFVRLRRLIYDAWPFQPDFESEPDWAERCAAVFTDLLRRDTFAAFVIDAPDQDGCLAACVSMSIECHVPGPGSTGRVGYLADMCTDTSYRGRGMGRALLEAALAWAEQQGAGGIHLYATESGQALYTTTGFRSGGPFLHMSRWRG